MASKPNELAPSVARQKARNYKHKAPRLGYELVMKRPVVLSDLRIQPRAGDYGKPNTKTGKETHADRLNKTCYLRKEFYSETKKKCGQINSESFTKTSS